jgi:hypothetical protein
MRAARSAVLLAGLVAAAAPAAPVPQPVWLTVRGCLVFPADKPVPRPKEFPRDARVRDADYVFAGGRRLFAEDVLIDAKTRGVKNAVVFLRPDSDDPKATVPAARVHPELLAAKPRTHVIDTDRCQFNPRVTVARAGDRVKFKNPTPVATNVHYQNPAAPNDPDRLFNVLLKPGTDYAPAWAYPALRGPDRFVSNIHPWMTGYVWAFDHPYAAVTAADGAFDLKQVPAGNWRLVVWQEKVGYRDGAAGKLGSKVEAVPGRDGTADLGPVVLSTPAWDEKPE